MGFSVPLNFAKKSTSSAKKENNVWTLDNLVDEDLIDEDELLDETDLIKPDVSSLSGKFNFYDQELNAYKFLSL